MNEDKKQKDEVNLGDWSPDNFPTSPKIVFKKSIQLVLFIGILCFLLYTCSKDDSVEEKKDTDKKISNESDELENPFGDEIDELDRVL